MDTVALRRKKVLVLSSSAMLGALAIAIDYAMKFYGAKKLISTPWMMAFPELAYLKFDLDGIPLFCAMAFFGLPAGALASVMLGLGIIIRAPSLSGLVGGSMKALAEFSTLLGSYLGLRLGSRASKRAWAWASPGLLTRAAIMCVANVLVVPWVCQMPLEALLVLLPPIALFNVLQGAITIYLGLSVAKAVLARASHILPEDAPLMAWFGK